MVFFLLLGISFDDYLIWSDATGVTASVVVSLTEMHCACACWSVHLHQVGAFVTEKSEFFDIRTCQQPIDSISDPGPSVCLLSEDAFFGVQTRCRMRFWSSCNYKTRSQRSLACPALGACQKHSDCWTIALNKGGRFAAKIGPARHVECQPNRVQFNERNAKIQLEILWEASSVLLQICHQTITRTTPSSQT